jgi:acyl carrier protein
MRETIRRFIQRELLSDRRVEDDEQLLVGGAIDSLGVMRLVAFIEASFGIRVPAGDIRLPNFATLDAIAVYVERRTAA